MVVALSRVDFCEAPLVYVMVMGIQCMFDFIANNGEWAIGVSVFIVVQLSNKCVTWTVVDEKL